MVAALFEFLNPEIHRIAQGYAINQYYEEEIDYLFNHIEEKTLEGTIIQYKFPKGDGMQSSVTKNVSRKSDLTCSRRFEGIQFQ